MTTSSASDDRERQELQDLRPYLGLAREIRDAVERFVDDEHAAAESLDAALGALPEREMAQVAASVFAQLSPTEQWAVLGRAVGDERLQALVALANDARLVELQRRVAAQAVAAAVRSSGQLDLGLIEDGAEVTVLLFRPDDVAAVLGRGRASDVCARELLLVATAVPGEFRVLADRFNPRRGLFVTAAYDESVWQSERLHGHSEVRIGSLDADRVVQPVVRPGTRLDVEAGGRVFEGHLHVGAFVIDDQDVVAALHLTHRAYPCSDGAEPLRRKASNSCRAWSRSC